MTISLKIFISLILCVLISIEICCKVTQKTSHNIPVVQRLLDDLRSAKCIGYDNDIALTCTIVTLGPVTLPVVTMPLNSEVFFPNACFNTNSRIQFYIGVENLKTDLPIKVCVSNFEGKEINKTLSLKNDYTKINVPLGHLSKSQKGIKIKVSAIEAKNIQYSVYISNPLIITPKDNEKKPNIFLLTVDTLAANHMSAYGYNKPTTRYFDELIHEGVFFENAFSSAPWTRPSYASIFTGLPPSIHKTFDKKTNNDKLISGNDGLEDEFQTMAEILQTQGYLTVGIYTVGNLSPTFGFAQGFDIYCNVPEGDKDSAHRRFTARDSANTFLKLLKEYEDVPCFYFLNIIDPHAPYFPPFKYVKLLSSEKRSSVKLRTASTGTGCYECAEDYKSTLRDIVALYDGEIAYTDYHLFRIISGIKKMGFYDSSIIIFTADHGEELGEHGGMGHGFKLYNEHIKVPLWIRYSTRLPSSSKISSPVGTISLLPTILDLIDCPYNNNRFWSPSLTQIIFDKKTYPIFVEVPNHLKAVESQRAIIFDNYKLIEFQFSKKQQLFNLKDDSQEKNNILDSQIADNEVVTMMRDLLQENIMRLKDEEEHFNDSIIQSPFNIENNKKLTEELKSLGYLQ